MNLCKSCLYFFICSFSFLIKKLQKRERTCRAYMKVLEHLLLPALLAAVPSSPPLCYCIRPGHIQQHAPSTLSCTPSSLCSLLFLSNCLTHRHNCTQSAFSNSKRSHLQLLRWLLYMDVSLCFFFSPSMRWQRFCFSLCFSLLCVF